MVRAKLKNSISIFAKWGEKTYGLKSSNIFITWKWMTNKRVGYAEPFKL